ncbi:MULTISPECIES: murein biosynthesis integral membrane protein MurJ [Micrococcaceae]|uniref:murein biosynthesis integral membrane protein MurJ n=1 Tax=unclassified Kocuria TaxID=2649579 RepID=UPI00101316F9|nr:MULTISPECIES: murein biosynthesis integral membrane protein MurJ [unclassified Kocuria]
MARTGARSSAIMAAGTMVSRLLGFVKTMLLAIAIGASTTTGNVFALANTLPNLIYVLVAAGVFNAVLVPQIIKASKKPDGGADYISRLLSLAIIGLFVITAIVVLCARPIISIMANDWSQEKIDFGTTFALWCFPQIFFYGLYTVVGQILNARGAFGAYMWAPVLNNVVAIASLLVFIGLFGSWGTAHHDPSNWSGEKTFWLAGMATIGVMAQALILFIPLKALKLGLGIKLGWRGIGLGTAARIGSWTLATGVVANLSFLFLARIATRPEGSQQDFSHPIAGNNVLDQSTMLYQLPHGVIGLSIATVLFNEMSRYADNNDNASLVETLSRGLRVASVATIFCAVALIVYAGPIGMLFGGGDPAQGAVIGQVISVIALGGPFLTIAFMMGRAFYAHEDAKTPLINQAISAVIVIILGFTVGKLPPQYIVFCLAGLYAMQNILATLLFHRGLRRWLGDYDLASIVKTHLRVTVSAIVAGVVGFVVLHLMGGGAFGGFAWHSQITAFVTILIGGLIMGVVYFGALRVFHVRELDSVLKPLKARLGR